jgi:hypothetical protein
MCNSAACHLLAVGLRCRNACRNWEDSVSWFLGNMGTEYLHQGRKIL